MKWRHLLLFTIITTTLLPYKNQNEPEIWPRPCIWQYKSRSHVEPTCCWTGWREGGTALRGRHSCPGHWWQASLRCQHSTCTNTNTGFQISREIRTKAKPTLCADPPFYPVLVVWDVFSVQQLVGRRVLPQFVLWCRTRVHERLSHHRQAGVCDAVLVDVKDKLGILNHIHPEPQWKTGKKTTESNKRGRRGRVRGTGSKITGKKIWFFLCRCRENNKKQSNFSPWCILTASKNSPVTLPSVPDVWVCYWVFVCLLIQEVKHVLDGERQGAAPVRCAEDGFKQVVHKLLQRTLNTKAMQCVTSVWGLPVCRSCVNMAKSL